MAIEATNELYESCIGTIEKACRDAYSRNPVIDFDDYRSYADEVFMDAVLSYNPASGTKFNTWLTTQLLRLKKYASRGGRMIVDHKETPESLVLSLDSKPDTAQDGQATLHDINQPVNGTYAASLAAPNWDFDWWKRMSNLKPYMGELSDDAKVMVEDILDGKASRTDDEGNLKPERGSAMYARLSPTQLYTRLYCRRGWDLDRVKEARAEVEDMLRRWAPCQLPEMEASRRLCTLPVKVVREGKLVAKSSAKFDRVCRSVRELKRQEVKVVKTQDELF